MGIILATLTMKAINETIERDQGASFRGWLGKVIPHIGDAYRAEDGGHRSHMGASVIGGDCARAIWYGFRWATKKKFDARILRLFNRGHLEEARFIALLLMIGCEVYQQDKDGNQFRIHDAGGHFGGSGDGVVIGLPDLAPGQTAVAEFKTHSEKSFKDVQAKGVRESKFEHFVQMNVYMRKMGIACALYMAVNKNTDEIHAEIVHLDVSVADQFIDRGRVLVFEVQPPKKLSDSPGYYKCRFCDHRPVCQLKAKPDRNCRTCRYSVAVEDGTWSCGLKHTTIDKVLAQTGCSEYDVSGVYEC